jgi:hypothetical protein
VTIDYRWADGRFDLLPAMAAEVAHRPVTLIVAFSPPAALAAKTATTTIPIVFHSAGDVIKMGLVASLNRPSGNATGVNLFTQALEAKKLDLLSKLVPTTAPFAYLMNPNNPGAGETTEEIREAGRQLHWAHSQGCKARGPAGAAAYQVRVAYQPEDSKDAQVEHFRQSAHARRSGDRIRFVLLHLLTSSPDAVDGSSTGTRVPWMWVLLKAPRFEGANHANDHHDRSRHRQIGFSGSRC